VDAVITMGNKRRHGQQNTAQGLYEWDGPQLAEKYARGVWRVLALVSVRGSIHYMVLPRLGRDELLSRPQVLAGAAAWWRLASVS